MQSTHTLLLSTACFGPASYFAAIAGAGEVLIEANETYPKQTWRNRYRIATANGLLDLTVPVVKVNGNHTKISEILISEHEDWQKLHWRAIESAYKHAPFFMYYEDAIKPFYEEKQSGLLEFNLAVTKTILKLIGFSVEQKLTESYDHKPGGNITDLRTTFSPKKEPAINFPRYLQVFEERHEFQPNLSILDLLFNLGPETGQYLREVAEGFNENIR